VIVLGGLGLLALGTSVYVIYTLEILKLRHLQAVGLFRGSLARQESDGDDVPQTVAGESPVRDKIRP
jgi:hypothetical protein